MENWFRHDSNAWMDTKMMALRAKHGLEGYGFFWAVIELLRSSSDGKILKDEKILGKFLNLPVAKAKQMLSTCLANALLIETEDGRIYSESLDRRVEVYKAVCEKRREAGSKGGKAKVANAKRSDLNRSDLISRSKDLESRVAAAPRITIKQDEFDKLKSEYGELFTQELAKASDWSLAKGKTHKDGGAFMRNWMRRAAAAQRVSFSTVYELKDFKTIEHENKLKREREAIATAGAVLETWGVVEPATKRIEK